MEEWTVNLLAGVGTMFRDTRQEAGLTQRQAAKIAGSTQAQISYLESGKMDVRVSTLQRWALVYGYEIGISLVSIEEGESMSETPLDFSLDQPVLPPVEDPATKRRTLQAQFLAFADYLRRELPDNENRALALSELEATYQFAYEAIPSETPEEPEEEESAEVQEAAQ